MTLNNDGEQMMDEVREITEDGEVLANFMYCPTSHQVSRGHVLSGSDRRRGSLRQAIKGPQKETNGWRSHLQEYRPVNKRREINRESNQWTRHYLDHWCFNHIYHCLNYSIAILPNLFLFRWISKLGKPALLLTENPTGVDKLYLWAITKQQAAVSLDVSGKPCWIQREFPPLE